MTTESREWQLKKFLISTVFKIDLKEDPAKVSPDSQTRRKIVEKCADRAYLDLCRTLKFADNTPDMKRREFRDAINKDIAERLNELLKTDQNHFDEKHRELCDHIKERADEEHLFNGFWYGQAQKWLNMTLKYVRLLGLWKNEFGDLSSIMHVPVDSYIIKAAKDELKISSSPKPKPWSEWTYTEYKQFQEDLQSAIKDRDPIDWENKAWIKQAAK